MQREAKQSSHADSNLAEKMPIGGSKFDRGKSQAAPRSSKPVTVFNKTTHTLKNVNLSAKMNMLKHKDNHGVSLQLSTHRRDSDASI